MTIRAEVVGHRRLHLVAGGDAVRDLSIPALERDQVRRVESPAAVVPSELVVGPRCVSGVEGVACGCTALLSRPAFLTTLCGAVDHACHVAGHPALVVAPVERLTGIRADPAENERCDGNSDRGSNDRSDL